jgi:hypothetical protein
VVTFDIKIVKRKKRSLRPAKHNVVSFSITFVPHPSIDLASLVAARAIKDDAFKPSIDSIEALLRRPILEDVDYVPLKWKKAKLDQPIFPLTYATYHRLWHRTCIVAGLREEIRPYTLRVGAGARLDGTL